MNKLELFSGTGGFSKGFAEAGFKFENTFFSEIDKHAIANYKYNFKSHHYAGSVININAKQLQKIDIISFGSPCQDFSLAGKGAGLDGEKSSLIREAIRLIDELRPSVFVWENVKGAYSTNQGRDFQAILREFANIGNYRLEWQLLNTSWFLPQNRERIYLVGHLAGRSFPGVFPFTENDETFIRKEKDQPRAEYSTTVNTRMGYRRDSTFIIPKKAGCLSAGGNSGGLHSDMTVIPVLTPDRKDKKQNGRRFKENGDPTFTLNCQDQQGVLTQKESTKGNSQGSRIYETTGISTNINSGGGGMGAQTGLYDIEGKIRRLTEIECERLQGFPDNWTEFGDYDGTIKEISKTQRYKMLGNAVSVPVVKAIAERLHKCLIK